jgi:hypothetical protein
MMLTNIKKTTQSCHIHRHNFNEFVCSKNSTKYIIKRELDGKVMYCGEMENEEKAARKRLTSKCP